MMRKFLLILLCACAFVGCREYNASNDPSLRLSFSTDTLRLDTVFTEQGSATLQVMVYNRNASALIIDRVWMETGTVFRVNIDGEPDLQQITSLQINGQDSLFVFVRINTDRLNSNSPVLIEDQVHFSLG